MPSTKPTKPSSKPAAGDQALSAPRPPRSPLPETMTAPPTNSTSLNYNDSPEFTKQTLDLSARLIAFTASIAQLGHDSSTYPIVLNEARDITNEVLDLRTQTHDYNASPEMRHDYFKLKAEFTSSLQDLEAELRVAKEKLLPTTTEEYLDEGERYRDEERRYRDEEEEVGSDFGLPGLSGLSYEDKQQVKKLQGAINAVENIFRELGVAVEEQRDGLMVIRGKQHTHAEGERNAPGWEQRRGRRQQCLAAVGLVVVVLISIFVVSRRES
ncbi:Similar to hypothetical protein [Tuber melanosporum Mel28]; acc. no. XP_002842183 [Pyronema omphalodes CBS 100304]|uniref:Uncharacterized protein n=1 Tax=Pyronema omphalodes (strain CBS 100304) TaxID=1076935 RepID=U4L4U4_PYROM|nr:Similar to hypothetical protein [Tuber melanosporum Mel28]; acc. no. XP_002842183 [Pyronema omphalodes CBS 100304]